MGSYLSPLYSVPDRELLPSPSLNPDCLRNP